MGIWIMASCDRAWQCKDEEIGSWTGDDVDLDDVDAELARPLAREVLDRLTKNEAEEEWAVVDGYLLCPKCKPTTEETE